MSWNYRNKFATTAEQLVNAEQLEDEDGQDPKPVDAPSPAPKGRRGKGAGK